MFLIHCPHCRELRDEEEFHYAGEAYIVRPPNPDAVSDEEWGDYVFFRTNAKGLTWEQWAHGAGCRKVFAVLRDNVSNHFVGTWTLAEGKHHFLQFQEEQKS